MYGPFFSVAVTSSFAFLVYYMRSERDKILTLSGRQVRLGYVVFVICLFGIWEL